MKKSHITLETIESLKMETVPEKYVFPPLEHKERYFKEYLTF